VGRGEEITMHTTSLTGGVILEPVQPAGFLAQALQLLGFTTAIIRVNIMQDFKTLALHDRAPKELRERDLQAVHDLLVSENPSELQFNGSVFELLEVMASHLTRLMEGSIENSASLKLRYPLKPFPTDNLLRDLIRRLHYTQEVVRMIGQSLIEAEKHQLIHDEAGYVELLSFMKTIITKLQEAVSIISRYRDMGDIVVIREMTVGGELAAAELDAAVLKKQKRKLLPRVDMQSIRLIQSPTFRSPKWKRIMLVLLWVASGVSLLVWGYTNYAQIRLFSETLFSEPASSVMPVTAKTDVRLKDGLSKNEVSKYNPTLKSSPLLFLDQGGILSTKYVTKPITANAFKLNHSPLQFAGKENVQSRQIVSVEKGINKTPPEQKSKGKSSVRLLKRVGKKIENKSLGASDLEVNRNERLVKEKILTFSPMTFAKSEPLSRFASGSPMSFARQESSDSFTVVKKSVKAEIIKVATKSVLAEKQGELKKSVSKSKPAKPENLALKNKVKDTFKNKKQGMVIARTKPASKGDGNKNERKGSLSKKQSLRYLDSNYIRLQPLPQKNVVIED
jgi:hypothetical protein